MELDRAEGLARGLMAAHGLVGWTFAFDRASTRAGACRFADRRISLSAPVTRQVDEAHVRDTVLHEIAHALVGPQHRHGPVWKAMAVRLGATPRARHTHPVEVDRPWIGVCPAGHESRRQRRPSAPLACGRCAPAFTLDALIEWRHASGVPARMTPRYEASLAASRRRAAGEGAVLRVLPGGPAARGPAARDGRPGFLPERWDDEWSERYDDPWDDLWSEDAPEEPDDDACARLSRLYPRAVPGTDEG